jgi:hypothetical protein
VKSPGGGEGSDRGQGSAEIFVWDYMAEVGGMRLGKDIYFIDCRRFFVRLATSMEGWDICLDF